MSIKEHLAGVYGDLRNPRWKNSEVLWDAFVAYLVPGPVYRVWMNWVYMPLRYRSFPWTPSACDTCPECQALEEN